MPQEAQSLDLPDKGFKSALLNMVKVVKEIMSKELKYENTVLPNTEH